GLRQGQPEMLDTLVIFVEGDDIGDGLFITLIVTHNELQFDTHPGASPSSSDRRIAQPILPEFEGYPQHLPALLERRPGDFRERRAHLGRRKYATCQGAARAGGRRRRGGCRWLLTR